MTVDRRALARIFWCDAFRRLSEMPPDLSPNAAAAVEIVGLHPELHGELDDPDAAVSRRFGDRESNPFLHLALHLSVREQVQSDFPQGVRSLYERLKLVLGDEHIAEHRLMDCTSRVMARALREGRSLDPIRYLNDLRKLVDSAASRH